mgnify:CR=1 FL=1
MHKYCIGIALVLIGFTAGCGGSDSADGPVDVYAAFSSERYRTDLAAKAIARAGASAVPAAARALQPVVEEA